MKDHEHFIYLKLKSLISQEDTVMCTHAQRFSWLTISFPDPYSLLRMRDEKIFALAKSKTGSTDSVHFVTCAE